MKISVATEGGVVIMVLSGDLVASTAGQLEAEVSRAVDGDFKSIMVDMSGVDFIDSTGLRACMSAHRLLLGKGGSLVYARPGEIVRRVLSVTGANQKLSIAQSRGEGMALLTRRV